MTKDQRRVSSFVIRFTQHLWKDQQGVPHLQWRGNIRHVQGDQQASFTDLEEALSFIRHHLTQLTLDASAGESQAEQKLILQQSFKLWEGLVSSYTDMMKDTIDYAFDQSDALKSMVDEVVARTLKSWDLPLGAENQRISAVLDKLKA